MCNPKLFHIGHAKRKFYKKHSTVKPVHTGIPWEQSFIQVWTGSGLDRVLFSERSKQR